MGNWGPVTYTVGSSNPSQFPMAQFKAVHYIFFHVLTAFLPLEQVNNPTTIKWTASSSQIGARTLRIRTTASFAGGRPQITVNSWTSSAPAGKHFHGLLPQIVDRRRL